MRTILLLLIALIFSTVVTAQTSSKEQEAVQQTIEKLFDALSNRDTAGIKAWSTSDVHFYEYGEVWTIDTLIRRVLMNKPADYKRTNSFEFVRTIIQGNTAWATYYLKSEITRNGKKDLVKWIETVVLVKDALNWKITVLHSTRLAVN